MTTNYQARTPARNLDRPPTCNERHLFSEWAYKSSAPVILLAIVYPDFQRAMTERGIIAAESVVKLEIFAYFVGPMRPQKTCMAHLVKPCNSITFQVTYKNAGEDDFFVETITDKSKRSGVIAPAKEVNAVRLICEPDFSKQQAGPLGIPAAAWTCPHVDWMCPSQKKLDELWEQDALEFPEYHK